MHKTTRIHLFMAYSQWHRPISKLALRRGCTMTVPMHPVGMCLIAHFLVRNGFKTQILSFSCSFWQKFCKIIGWWTALWITVRCTNIPLCVLQNLVELTTNIFVNLHIEQKWLIWPRSLVTLMLESLVYFPYHILLLLLLNPHLLVRAQIDHWPSYE